MISKANCEKEFLKRLTEWKLELRDVKEVTFLRNIPLAFHVEEWTYCVLCHKRFKLTKRFREHLFREHLNFKKEG